MTKIINPSIDVTAFNCPVCGTLTSQTWFECFVSDLQDKNKTPFVFTQEVFERITKSINAADEDERPSDEVVAIWQRQMDSIHKGCPSVEKFEGSLYPDYKLGNLHFSRCYSCDEVSIWLNGKLIHPQNDVTIQMNPDMPIDVQSDFAEARKIVHHSSRGAAALLRLCIEKICRKVTGSSKTLNDMISDLVKEGLNPTIQKSLDTVRVIGNNAVHPLEMDIRDDEKTALILFELVNAIIDQLISHPNKVGSIYSKLPPKTVEAIDKRDAKISKAGEK